MSHSDMLLWHLSATPSGFPFTYFTGLLAADGQAQVPGLVRAAAEAR